MIIVDRDPRDVVLSMINHNKAIGAHLRKSLDADLFIKWFLKTRNHGKRICDPRIKYFKYEDLIIHYEDNKNKIFEFLNIMEKDHEEKMKFFDPAVSCKRMKKWEHFDGNRYFDKKEWSVFQKKIEKDLSEYLYEK